MEIWQLGGFFDCMNQIEYNFLFVFLESFLSDDTQHDFNFNEKVFMWK